MRLLLITVGSRGDAEPYQALADTLAEGGHQVEFFLQPEHSFPAKKQVTLHPLPFSTSDFYRYAGNPRYGQDHENPRVKFVGVVAEVVSQLVLPLMEDVSRVAADCDILICNSLARHMCFCIGKSLRKPVGLIHLQPMAPTRSFPHYSSEDFVDCILNGCKPADEHEQWYWTLEQYAYDFLKEDLEKATAATGSMLSFDEIRPMLAGTSDLVHSFNCYSTDLCPAQYSGGNIHDVGALADRYIPSDFSSLPELLEFCEKMKPVAIGFGSMPFAHAQAVISGLEAIQCRAVLVGDALAAFEPTPWTKANIVQVRSVPYPWLLPHCRCMVSHGGAGVLHSTLRAGIPAVIAPLMGDQFAWARLVDARYLGINAGPMNTLSADALVDSLKRLDARPECASNAKEFAMKIKDRDSPKELVKLLEQIMM